MDTHYNPNRKIYESDFIDFFDQQAYLEKQRWCTTRELTDRLKIMHSATIDILFRKVDAGTNEERRSYTLRQHYEAVQDMATVLKDRNALPAEFEPFVLNIDELPWNRHETPDPTLCAPCCQETEPQAPMLALE